jgi:hypothetical protein
MASISSWDSFSAQWQALLDREPKLEYFKMKEAAALRGQFYRWRAEERDTRVMDFVRIVRDCNPVVGISSAVFWEDLTQISGEFPDVRWHPYDLLFHGSMAILHGFCRRKGIKEKIDFVFDEQGKWGERTIKAYDYVLNVLTEEEQSLLGNRPIHRNDKTFLPLQAADLIAWHTRRFMEENKDISPLAPIEAFSVNYAALRELERIETLYNTYGLPRLRNMGRDFQASSRLLGTEPDIDRVRNWYKDPPQY